MGGLLHGDESLLPFHGQGTLLRGGYCASLLNTGQMTSEEGLALLGMGGKTSCACCQSNWTLPSSKGPWGGQPVSEAEELFPLSLSIVFHWENRLN